MTPPTVRPSDRHAIDRLPVARLGVLVPLIASIASILLMPVAAEAADDVSRSPTISSTSAKTSPPAKPHTNAISFAVLANIPSSVTYEDETQNMLQWIAEAGQVHFIVDLGNVRGADESCGNALFARRQALLNATPAPLVFVPGVRDWVDCARPGAGSFDPTERLDAVRDLFLSGNLSLGTPAMRVIRQSELPAFTPYRENMRWIDDGVVFATLNVPGGNNHFVDGGGRNGEYEDREVANRNWIDHAVTDAQRRHARGLVFLFEGDPGFATRAAQAAAQRVGGSHWAEPFDWWFRRPRERDGYASLRRDLLRAVARFDGPVLIIHGRDTPRINAPHFASSPAETARGTNNVTAKRGVQHTSHDAKHDGRQAELALPPTVAVETLTHAPDGLLLHDVKQVMVDNPAGSRQWLRVTLPQTDEPHAGSAAGTRGNAVGAARARSQGREHAPSAHRATFQIRVESADDVAATAPSAAATANAPGSSIKAIAVGRGSTSTVLAQGTDAQGAHEPDGRGAPTSPPSPANDMGLPPWPGKAFRFHRNGSDDGAANAASDSSGMSDRASLDNANAKSTSGHDVPQSTFGPYGQKTSAPDASDPRSVTGGVVQNPSPLPGELPDPADPVETGIAEGSDSTGTSALNGITQPKMLPLPPVR